MSRPGTDSDGGQAVDENPSSVSRASSHTELRVAVMEALHEVTDPEIPAVNLMDMGMIYQVNVKAGSAAIEILPTFVGCPALDVIRQRVVKRVLEIQGVNEVEVRFVYDVPWTSSRISAHGREKLVEFGIAAPLLTQSDHKVPDCPYCGAGGAEVVSLFGPAACRSIFYCHACKQPFEGMKTV